jgi:hypothetical protein
VYPTCKRSDLDGYEDLMELVITPNRDGKFQRQVETDETLRRPFAPQILLFYHNEVIEESLLNTISMERTLHCIREGLLNRGHFAVKQKELQYSLKTVMSCR